MAAESVPGPHLDPQHEQVRASAPGEVYSAEGVMLTGQSSVLIVIRCKDRPGWVFYLDGDPRLAVMVQDRHLGPILRLLGGE